MDFKRKIEVECRKKGLTERQLINKMGWQSSSFYNQFKSKGGIPGPTPRGEKYFNKKFALIRKALGLSRFHTIYGFRHTVISDLLRNGANKFDVMKYTGHTTLSAFEKYIRSIYAEPPADLTHKLSEFMIV